jgi:tripartite-type tricarboxylate transporter receptor subunit TctC
MLKRPFAILLSAVAATVFIPHGLAQNYPRKPVRIVTSEPGGGTDVVARVIADGLTHALGQEVIVDNRGAAGGAIGAEMVAHSAPDGYNLLFQGSNIWLLPYLRSNVPFDPAKDFTPVTMATSSPNVLVVHPALPVSSVRDLIALAKSKPGELNYSTGLIGGSTHLSPALFNAMAGVNIVQVAYKGGPAAINDLVAGRVQVMFPTIGTAMPFVKAGRLRALAVTTARPSALMPELPTIAASGLPGYEFLNVTAMFAPANTPPAIVNQLYEGIVRVMNQPDATQKFLRTGSEVIGSSPSDFSTAMKADMARMGKLIRDASIRDDQ